MAPTLRSTQSLSLRTVTLALTLSVLLTSAAIASWLGWRTWVSQRDMMQSQLARVADALGDSIGRELESGLRKLQAITLDLPVQRDAAEASLLRRARALLAINPDLRAVALNSATGSQIWNTRLRESRWVPPRLIEHEQRALHLMQPLVSNLYESRSQGDLLASFVVPVVLGGAERVLVGSIDVTAWSQRLMPLVSRQGGVAAVVDTNRRIVTRTSEPQRWLGKFVSDDWAPAFGEQRTGLVRVVTREGVDAYGAWSRLPGTGWTLLIAVPAGPWEETLLSSIRHHLALVAALAGIGSALAWWFGHVLVRGADRLSRNATHMVVDRKVEQSPIAIREFETIRQGLVQAAELLRQQDERAEQLERARAELLAKEQAARRESDEANRFKDEFLGVLGHEMRSPLAAVLHGAGALDKRLEHDARARSLAQAIQRQARALTRMVEDLTEVGRLISGNVPLEVTRVDLADVVRQAVQVLELAQASGDHRLDLSLDAVEIEGDADRLQQMVINLLVNALRYTPANGSIHVRLHRLDQPVPCAELRVQDSGIGMRPEDLDRVFGLFVQVGPRGVQRRGLGIGLSVVRRVVERHNGRVWAESQGPGHGSTFIVQLPLA
ncbi:sensor histidine kinase [Ramlibacter sp. AW1]|uniref:histidine kinase n=1 Tax=Ramlibacter aurantiacus TaxID=2801330 RepID=A0A937D6D5_9BURK|nr:sensor histidine kinase [Ramlibacter aurantiacus]MBL0419706.1 sensor histidine kinase [Ramlibacter aurantiacus]